MTSINNDPLHANLPGSKSKKHKKKKGAVKSRQNSDVPKPLEVKIDEDDEAEEADKEEQESKTTIDELNKPSKNEESEVADIIADAGSPNGFASNVNGKSTAGEQSTATHGLADVELRSNRLDNLSRVSEGPSQSETRSTSQDDIEARLDAMAQEREALRDEVAGLRRSLEGIQEKHNEELGEVRDQLEEKVNEKEHAESQYRNLLGKVNTIRSQLGDRLKADAEDLSQARSRIEDLEEQCESLRGQNEARTTELSVMAEEAEQRAKELSSLRNRMTLSQQNWSKEREDLIEREAFAREEFEAAKQAMQDWEILAMEERSIRESTSERISDLEEQVSVQREAHEKAASERDSQSLTIDGLQRALQEIQDARRRELRELVENSQSQIEGLQKQLHDAQGLSAKATKNLELTKNELERALPFEKEVKEKNLLIGKLRHEAVILNDHLTKALRYLKKGKPEDNIDKQLVSNHFLHFLALERADPKKFQVLQIIAALLGWSDGTSLNLFSGTGKADIVAEQREQAGLSRPGASNPNLRVPISPWHRTPSTPSLPIDYSLQSSSRKESLAELWSDFLEQEAQDGTNSPKSSASSARSPSLSSSSKPTGLGISPQT
ncbi:MAG: hypothetical protein Q9167_001524 [Letrouitia subvulpina]